MSPIFRPLTCADLDAMQAVEQAAHSHPWSRNILAGNFGERYFNGSLWQPTNESDTEPQLLGYFIANSVLDESTLMNICVAPAAQGQGLGRQLLTHYLTLCAQRNISQCWLEVRASNIAAQNLYSAYGYQEYDCRRDYYQTLSGNEDAVLMALTL